MTDKQIIIDGVDVSGCSFFDIHYLEDEDVEIKNFCRIVHYDCDSYPNCYYKQLKRKEQECEQKEKELLSNEKIINKLMKEVDESSNCHKALVMIEDICNVADRYELTELQEQILSIIHSVKGCKVE